MSELNNNIMDRYTLSSQNTNLVRFQNGVFDLRSNTFKTVDNKDKDSCLPINYTEYKETDDEVQNVIEFLAKVFTDEAIRTHFLDIYSNIFNKENPGIIWWSGSGANGKSTMRFLIEKMLNKRAVRLSPDFLEKRSGIYNPELARLNPPVLHATIEEPYGQFDHKLLRRLAYREGYYSRDSLGNYGVVTPEATITIIQNNLSNLEDTDFFCEIPFESTFSHTYPTTLEEQINTKIFPRDEKFRNKIPEMAEAFAWYLLNWRKPRLV